MSKICKGCKWSKKKNMEIPGGWGGPPTTLWNGNSRGVGGFKLKNHPWGGGVWIFSGITHCDNVQLSSLHSRHQGEGNWGERERMPAIKTPLLFTSADAGCCNIYTTFCSICIHLKNF